jgi:AcrR family transcriptional regulator
MSRRVNPQPAKRTYDATRRRQQAAETRRAILRAAQVCLERDGYARTTMADIAAEAGVAVKTVYIAFATKAGLLRALWDVLLRGEDDAPVAAQDWYREVVDERDPVQRLRKNAHNSRVVKERIGGLLVVIRDGAALDADVEALWELIQTDFWSNQRVVVDGMRDALPRDLDIDAATDVLWTLVHPDVWNLLVRRRGWTPQRYERWIAETSCAQLLSGEK